MDEDAVEWHLWDHVIDADGELWRWKTEGTADKHGSIEYGSEDTGLIRAATSVDALRWLVADGPIYGYGDLDFDKEFMITLGPAEEEAPDGRS